MHILHKCHHVWRGYGCELLPVQCWILQADYHHKCVHIMSTRPLVSRAGYPTTGLYSQCAFKQWVATGKLLYVQCWLLRVGCMYPVPERVLLSATFYYPNSMPPQHDFGHVQHHPHCMLLQRRVHAQQHQCEQRQWHQRHSVYLVSSE